ACHCKTVCFAVRDKFDTSVLDAYIFQRTAAFAVTSEINIALISYYRSVTEEVSWLICRCIKTFYRRFCFLVYITVTHKDDTTPVTTITIANCFRRSKYDRFSFSSFCEERTTLFYNKNAFRNFIAFYDCTRLNCKSNTRHYNELTFDKVS